MNEARTKGEVAKCLVVRCFASKAVFGHVIPCKGLDEDNFVVKLVIEDLSWLGHTRLILKSDQERALVALVTQAAMAMRYKVDEVPSVAVEHSAKYDSQASGGTEVGVKLLRGLFRSVKLCLEARINMEIPVDHPMIASMMEHASLLLNALVRGTDGLTAWKRVRGRSFGQPLVGIGESVL